jgi:hypothetical protein
MATKREEIAAFRRLQKEFPGEYVVLTLEYVMNYGKKGTLLIQYGAYHEGKTEEERATTGISCLTPDEAIDELIKMREERKEVKSEEETEVRPSDIKEAD